MTHYMSVFNAISVTIEYSSFLKYREKSNWFKTFFKTHSFAVKYRWKYTCWKLVFHPFFFPSCFWKNPADTQSSVSQSHVRSMILLTKWKTVQIYQCWNATKAEQRWDSRRDIIWWNRHFLQWAAMLKEEEEESAAGKQRHHIACPGLLGCVISN